MAIGERDAANLKNFCRPLKRALDSIGWDPGVTLAVLAHPGLNSAAAPRLDDAFIQQNSHAAGESSACSERSNT
jgi:hypothetical protein